MGRHLISSLPEWLKDTSRWPALDMSQMPESQAETYAKYQRAITAYVRGTSLAAVARDAGIPRTKISKKLARCLTLASDGAILGWRALLPYVRASSYTRIANPPTGAEAAHGYAGAFSQFLKSYPEIELELRKRINQKNHPEKDKSKRYWIGTLADDFQKICRAHGLTEKDYPLCSPGKAIRSLYRYKTLLESCGQISAVNSTGARAPEVGTGLQSELTLFSNAYDLASIDGHRIDCFGTVAIQTPDGPAYIPFERLWLIPIQEAISRAVLGYRLFIGSHITSAAVEDAILHALTPWAPWEFKTKDIEYIQGAGFPSMIPELAKCFPAILTLDNALEHLSDRIREKVRRRLGLHLCYGAIGNWSHNSLQERLHRALEARGFHRIPSTTGGRSDLLRMDPVSEAKAHQIELNELIEFTEALIANYNATPKRSLGRRSPLQVLKEAVNDGILGIIPCRISPPTHSVPELGVMTEVRTVRNARHKRNPYVQFDNLEYTSQKLVGSPHLVGQKLVLHIPDRDIRKIEAYRGDGQYFGSLRIMGRWRFQPLPRELHNMMLHRDEYIDTPPSACEERGDLDQFSRQVESGTLADARKRPKKLSKFATQLAKFRHAKSERRPYQQRETTSSLRPKKSISVEVSTRRPLPQSSGSTKWRSIVK